MKIQKLSNSENVIKENNNMRSKEERFSLVKWLFED